MTQTLDDLVKRFQGLVNEWDKKNHDLTECSNKIRDITSALTKFSFLPNKEAEATKRELLIARDTLEIAICLDIEMQDIPSFENHMSQLKNTLPESSLKYEILGLNLLRLLAQGRLADFHVELERIPLDKITSNVYINHPVSMEQYLMEGNFHKVFLSKGNVPSKRYHFFIDILLNTTREEVASCIKAAYDKLSLEDAVPTLFFDSKEATRAFEKKCGWKLEKGNVYYFPKNTKNLEDTVSSSDIIKVMLDYTKELDQII